MMAENIALLYCDLLHIGGVETHILSLLSRSAKAGRRWIVMAPVSPLFKARAEALGAEIATWKPAHAMDPLALIGLIRLLNRYNVDILHAHSARAAIFGQLAASLTRKKMIVTFHQPMLAFAYTNGSMGDCRYWLWLYIAIAKVLNRLFTDRIIHVSNRVRQEACELGLAPLDKTAVVRNGIDLSKFLAGKPEKNCRREMDVDDRTVVVCCVGRLHDQKGIDVLIDALQMIGPEKRNLQAWIVGDGSKRSELSEQVVRAGLDKSVRFLGFRKDIPDILRASDIFVLPSRFEADPMSIMEAMAVGLPCVVTDTGENDYLVRQGRNGFVVPPEDPEALARALEKIASAPDIRRRMGRASKKRASAFCDKKMALMVEREYRSV